MTALTNARPVRLGILGTARIATKVGRAIALAHGAELAAVASRDLERARRWVHEHTRERAGPDDPARFIDRERPIRTFGSYQALLDDREIDAVYIPLPPALHAEWTIRAAQCGKHVLCEKPLAASLTEAREMAAECRRHNVQLMDGVMWYHHDRTAAMERVLGQGTLGALRRVTSAFSFNASDFRPDNIRYQRDLAGGVLGDLGWYCVGATLWAFRELPVRVQATARYRYDVDINLSAMLWFAGERCASFDCAFDTTLRKWFEVSGTEASLVCDDFVQPWNPDQTRFWVHDQNGKASQETFSGCTHEVKMIERLCQIVQSGKLEDRWVRESLATQYVCDLIDRSARSGVAVDVEHQDF